jgi:hypothetical protein
MQITHPRAGRPCSNLPSQSTVVAATHRPGRWPDGDGYAALQQRQPEKKQALTATEGEGEGRAPCLSLNGALRLTLPCCRSFASPCAIHCRPGSFYGAITSPLILLRSIPEEKSALFDVSSEEREILLELKDSSASIFLVTDRIGGVGRLCQGRRRSRKGISHVLRSSRKFGRPAKVSGRNTRKSRVSR